MLAGARAPAPESPAPEAVESDEVCRLAGRRVRARIVNSRRALLRLLAVPLLAGLGGCAGLAPPLPAGIAAPPPGNLQLVEVLRDIPAHVGARVRWGGNVVLVTAEAGGARRIEVLERKLDAGGEPIQYSPSDGRFVIRAAPSVDPARYAIGAEITVAGTVRGAVKDSTGATVPLVEVASFVDWAPPVYYQYQPCLGDPFCDPFCSPFCNDPWFPPPFPRYHHHRFHH